MGSRQSSYIVICTSLPESYALKIFLLHTISVTNRKELFISHKTNMAFKRYILFAILVQFRHSKCFECPGYSIPRKFRCDAVNNCGDNSDEEGCPTSNADFLDEDESREDELLQKIAELEQKLLETEVPKKVAQVKSEEPIVLRLGVPKLNSTQKRKDETEKSELKSQIKQLEEKLSEAELTNQKVKNQLEQIQDQFKESSASVQSYETRVTDLVAQIAQLKLQAIRSDSTLENEKEQLEKEVSTLKKELNELKRTLKGQENDMNLNQGDYYIQRYIYCPGVSYTTCSPMQNGFMYPMQVRVPF